jgi:hypothetical protein
MMKIRFRSIVLAVFLFVLAATNVSAQCRNIAKKQCFPQLKPYIQNGQFNSARLAPGETAEVQMTFYAGQDYRLMICAEAVLGEVTFKILDAEKNELFNSKKSEVKLWDFNVASTQPLIVQVEVPTNDTPNKLVPDGCVSILVGFKKQ